MPRPEFAHMMPEDIPVWKRWLDTHEHEWERIDYDVKVGEGCTLPDDCPEPFRTQALTLSKKRIDAVLIFPDFHVTIEVKKLASWKALAQTMGYPILYHIAFPDVPDVKTLLVAEDFTLDMRTIMNRLNIPYEQVPLDPGTLQGI